MISFTLLNLKEIIYYFYNLKEDEGIKIENVDFKWQMCYYYLPEVKKMIRLYENELNAIYLDLTKKYLGASYCTDQELIDFKNAVTDLSFQANLPVVIFGNQGSRALFYTDGTHISILPEAKDIMKNTLNQCYEKLSSITDNGILYEAFLQAIKKELDREEETLHAKKLKYLQLSCCDHNDKMTR